MSVICKLFILVCFQTIVLANDSIKPAVKMAYVIDGLNHIQYKDTRIAFDLLIEGIAEHDNLEISILYYKKDKEAVSDYVQHKYGNITINTYLYLKNREAMDKVNKQCWIIKQSHDDYEQYVLLAKDSKIKTLKDLDGKKIAITQDNYLGKMFLENESMLHLGKDVNHFSYKQVNMKKNSTAILKTFFGKVDACLVPLYALDIVSELNPIVGKTLNKLIVSKKIFAPVLAFSHKSANEAYINIYANHVKNLKNSVRGQNILDLFNITGVKEIQCHELKPMQEYYDSYKALQRSTK